MKVNIAPPLSHEEKTRAAIGQFQRLLARGERVSIRKNVKHTFKEKKQKANLDLRAFNEVISIDTEANTVCVEGFTSFMDLVDVTLTFDRMPQAVPELRSITVGGAIAGLGGQSSSFRFGLIHEMVSDFDLLSGEGEVLHCSPDSNADLFYMLPNSYGSLGYVLKCTLKLNKVMPYVRMDYVRFAAREPFFARMAEVVGRPEVDFVEGVSFAADNFILLNGRFVEHLPPGEERLVPLTDPFFLSVRDPGRARAYMTIRDYIWRWDPDAFWATDQQNLFGLILLNPRFRKTLGPVVLRSDRLIQIGKFRNRLRKKGSAATIFMEAQRREALIQDAAIPFDRAAEFDAWLAENLAIFPLWYCPVKTTQPIGTYPLYQPGSELVIDFGFYTSMDLDESMDDYYYNMQIERKLLALGGIKCLYSDTFFPEDEFWSIYDRRQYERVKQRYDPNGVYLDLYSKVITKPRVSDGGEEGARAGQRWR